MNDVVIRIQNVSKEYKLGVIGYGMLSKDIQSRWAQFLGKEDPNAIINAPTEHKNPNKRFWALSDVSFDVKQGEIIGIIGSNGAGKSTLLKILSRVTTPTKGVIKIKGKIASLLEVGTGFHPELTGRENIFLNGAILGMSKKEIESKFNEIVQFAEIERFIDTPVKRYSSGMYVRLAFAVAAHLEPEILIIDEVLAVGDVNFRKKCLGKIKSVSQGGRTILYVSHDLASIRTLCSRAILLNKGKIIKEGEPNTVVNYYEESLRPTSTRKNNQIIRVISDNSKNQIKIKAVKIFNTQLTSSLIFNSNDSIIIELEYDPNLPPLSYLEWIITNEMGFKISSGGTFMCQKAIRFPSPEGILRMNIGPLQIAEGNYFISLRIGEHPGFVIDQWENIETFKVVNYCTESDKFQFDSRRGVISLNTVYQ